MEEIHADIKQRIERAWQNENQGTFDALKQLIYLISMRVDFVMPWLLFIKHGPFEAALNTTNDA